MIREIESLQERAYNAIVLQHKDLSAMRMVALIPDILGLLHQLAINVERLEKRDVRFVHACEDTDCTDSTHVRPWISGDSEEGGHG